MSVIQKIKDKLAKYPHIAYEHDGDTLSVTPEGGFTVWITDLTSAYRVGFDGWHNEFTDEYEALDRFAFGLSEDCRLEVTSRGTTEYKWTLQAYERGEWVSYDTTGLVFFPYWRRKKVEYRRNYVIAGS